MKLQNKWALVTGGSRGIGKGICIELAKEGCNVVVNYISDPKVANNTVSEIKNLGVNSYSIKADVSNRDQVNKMIAEITSNNELDILISNAGVVKFEPFLEITKEALDYKKQGYLGMKQRACAGPREGRKGMQRNEMLVKTVREAVGDDIEIMIDAYMSWSDIDYAVEMIKRLEKYNLTWVEEPLLPDDFSGYKYLRTKVGTPIAAGEHEYTRFGFRDLIENKVLDVLQPDITRMGGITEAKKVIAMAEAFNIQLAPHIDYPETVHVVMSSPMVKWAEDPCKPSWEKTEGSFSDAYIKDAPKAVNGFMELDENKPGLGFELNYDVINKIKV
ncbi:MAG: SDR family NAD(P)-dependent oxidoreductase [Actinobacteria bacterium]|nr:SDR family NAD(P)-dependent oxidoreductase [Cyanobacteriota bacterium]MCL5771478.1 SDR family NAD(P)-dependent oxidoreductase [Actinomycetota bacterium]